MMDGVIDWNFLPVIIEIFGIDDVEIFISDLLVIRARERKKAQ